MKLKSQIAVCLTLVLSLTLAPFASHARYLNPNTGRFQTMDTYEGNNSDPLSLHKYLYAAADPVMRIDPGGQEFSLVGLSIAGGIASGIEAWYDGTIMAAGWFVLDSLSAIQFGKTTADALPDVYTEYDYEDGVTWSLSVNGFGGDEVFSLKVNVGSSSAPGPTIVATTGMQGREKGAAQDFLVKVIEGGEQARDARGRFMKKTGGQTQPGSTAEDSFAAFMQANGFEVVRNISVKTPFQEKRTYEVGIRSPQTGEIDVFEIKSTEGAFSRWDEGARKQFASDRYLNMRGGLDAIGQHKGMRVKSAVKVGWHR